MLNLQKSTSLTMFQTESNDFDLKINFPKDGKKFVSVLCKMHEVYEDDLESFKDSNPNYVLSKQHLRKSRERIKNLKAINPTATKYLAGIVLCEEYSYTIDISISATKVVGIARYKHSSEAKAKESKLYIAFDSLNISNDGQTGFYKCATGFKGASTLVKRNELKVSKDMVSKIDSKLYNPKPVIARTVKEMKKYNDIFTAKYFADIAIRDDMVRKELMKRLRKSDLERLLSLDMLEL